MQVRRNKIKLVTMCKLEYNRDTLLGLLPHASKTPPTDLRKVGICRTATHRSKKPTQDKGNNISVKFAPMNAQSVMNKKLAIYDHIVDNNLDLLAITETWETANSQTSMKELLPDGYEITHQARTSSRGGGVAFVHRQNITCKLIKIPKPFKTFQMIEVMVTVASSSLRIAVVYRPPNLKNVENLKATFFDELKT